MTDNYDDIINPIKESALENEINYEQKKKDETEDYYE
jgi:hypothetical protein